MISAHQIRWGLLLIATGMLSSCAHVILPEEFKPAEKSYRKYDLVLVHGLTNKHALSEKFLGKCLEKWGSGNVYILYNNRSNRVWGRVVEGRQAICSGEDDSTAGDDFIEVQARYMHEAVALLQNSYGLGEKFHIIAHSMGGLVSRYYIYQHPDTVAGLVTLGTPHHGAPLAGFFSWFSPIMGASDAMDNLKPEYLKIFNEKYPPAEAPMAAGGKIHTIRGDADGWDCLGWGGELRLGWCVMRLFYGTDSDGLVPEASALIEGAVHIADFRGDDHYDLVRNPEVAETAAEYLK